MKRAIWTVPAARMKAGCAYRVPLSSRTVAILEEMAVLREGDGNVVFPSRGGRQLSTMSMEALLRRMKAGDVTVHGFR